MADSTSLERRPAVRTRLVVTVLLLAVIALVVYFEFVRQVGPRHLKLALVTWTQDPFWKPLLRGAQDCADKSDVDLTIVQSKPSVDEQTQHIRDLLGSGVDGIADTAWGISATDPHGVHSKTRFDSIAEGACVYP